MRTSERRVKSNIVFREKEWVVRWVGEGRREGRRGRKTRKDANLNHLNLCTTARTDLLHSSARAVTGMGLRLSAGSILIFPSMFPCAQQAKPRGRSMARRQPHRRRSVVQRRCSTLRSPSGTSSLSL